MNYYKDKVIWITGASSGIGEALAVALYNQGARLILSARREEALKEVKQKCSGADDPNIQILPLDLSDVDKMAEKTEEAISLFGQINIFFSNGGVSQRSLAAETHIDVTRRVMDINFMGAAAISRILLQHMIERKTGHIIVTSSVTGKFGTRLRSTYAASKHALHGYFDSVRQEVRQHNIAVTMVCPGFIKTDVSRNALTSDGSKYGIMSPGQQNGMEPAEYAQRVLPKIAKRKMEIYIGGSEITGIYVKRFFPTLFYNIIRKLKIT